MPVTTARLALDVGDGAAVDTDPEGREPALPRLVDLGDAVREDDDVARPLREQQRALHEVVGLADEEERLVALLVAVALHAAVHGGAVVRADAREVGQRLHEAGGDEDPARVHLAVGRASHALRADGEAALRGLRGLHDGELELALVVPLDLDLAELAELERGDPVAGDEAVRHEGRGVARTTAVEHERAAAGAHEVQRGGQARGARADDDDVVRVAGRGGSRARVVRHRASPRGGRGARWSRPCRGAPSTRTAAARCGARRRRRAAARRRGAASCPCR